jgi:adenosylhomocysteine nucleosidase
VVISAVPAELEALLRAATIERTETIAGRVHHVGRLEGHPVVLFLSGVSMVNAAAATQAVIDHFDVGGIVFSGIAGGVNPNLAVGDVAVPAQWGQHQEMVFGRETEDGWETDGRAGEFENFGMMFPRGQLMTAGGPEAQPEGRRFWFPVDTSMLVVARDVAANIELQRCVPSGECLAHQPRIVVGGNGVSGSTFLNNAEFREWIWRVFEADAVDMETAAIAQVAALNRVPFLGFRSLSDLSGGGPGANEIRIFGRLAAANSAAVLLEFLREWRGLS